MNLNFAGSGVLAGPMVIYAVAIAIIGLLVHVAFAMAVYGDASDRRPAPVFVGAGMWGLATLLGGVVVAALYWAMHHSTLVAGPAYQTPPSTETGPQPQ